MKKIKVLIVDDSALVRQFLSETLASDPAIEVIGTAIDPIFAFAKIMKEQPDVITLDVEMPRMDGLTFLSKMMESYPIPVVMISAQTTKGCETTMRALELGAVDFITKPQKSLFENLDQLKGEIIRKVKNAALANLKTPAVFRQTTVNQQVSTADQHVQHVGDYLATGKPRIVVIGASTGGVSAVRRVLEKTRASQPILTVLHMPGGFTASFAKNMDAVLPYRVMEAQDGMLLEDGCVYVAPGNKNTIVVNQGNKLLVQVQDCSADDVYRPSVDKAFYSVARASGNRCIAVILTGMGDDGARGMALLKQAGAMTIAQSQETCLIFGMPKKAIEAGGVDWVAHLDEIGHKITELAQ